MAGPAEPKPTVAPYGSWASPLSSDAVAAAGVRLDSPAVDGTDRYWIEGRPEEQGRQVLVRRTAEGAVADVTPAPFSVRTRAHEYGGGAYLVAVGTVFFSNFADQRLWRRDQDGEPVPLTADPSAYPSGVTSVRYADARLAPGGDWLICVRETHHGPRATDVVNELVAVASRPGTGGAPAPEHVLASGHDFFSFPRLSSDGRRLAWTCWDHPRMPWDGTECWVAELSHAGPGGPPTLSGARWVAGGPEESVFQPEWGPDAILHYVSDRGQAGWWHLYRHDLDGGAIEALGPPGRGEWGRPQWVFGLSTYAFLADGRLVATWSEEGSDHLGTVTAAGSVREMDVPYTTISQVRAAGNGIVFIGAGPQTPPEVVEIPVDAVGRAGTPAVLARSRALDLGPADTSVAEPVEFLTAEARTAHAFYYPPTNSRFRGPEDERPPLVVMSHGGPTSATTSALNLTIQYWTSRGLAVVDVNYGGSTGYGRPYRERLKGRWGIVDVDDCVNAALWLAKHGQVDGTRLAIRGGSAGGYTTLCALTFRDTFAVGASYYGVSDAAALAADTHKFESRYTDGLIGPWPEAADTYAERSPVAHTDLLARPVIVFQGLDDPIVLPNQAEAMVAALRERHIPHAYLAFEGEQHGFRRAGTLRRCLEAELSFYAAVLGFTPADDLGPLTIER